MRSPPRRDNDSRQVVRLSSRLEALEDRLRRLELRVRPTESAHVAREPPAKKGRKKASKPARPDSTQVRPRCPGCTLELPRGRRGGVCVWCGFHFAAVRLLKRKR